MRRKDREVTEKEEIKNILNSCKTCHLAMAENNIPYVVPLSYGYQMENDVLTIYFHSAAEGKKIDILKNNHQVCFEMCQEGRPVFAKETPCNSGYYYSSVIGFGQVTFIEDAKEKCDALKRIVLHQSGFQVEISEEQAAGVCVYKVATTDYTGKRKAEAKAHPGKEPGQDDEKKPSCVETNCVNIYVDGSYNKVTNEFSYGMVVLRDGREECYCERFHDEALATMHNVAGEIKGAEAAMQYALDHKLSEINIFHDYEGIAKWCLGQWKANKDGTKAYKNFFNEASKSVRIQFSKVTGHSHDKYNDMADKLAKKALGLEKG